MSDLPDVIIWIGPVFASTPSEVTWLHPTESIALTGEGSTFFSNLAESLRGPDGHILPQILAKAGKTRADYRKIAVAGFSAAHGLMPKLLDADGDDIAACVAIDSCFSAMGSLEKAGYVSFSRRAASGEKLMVFTVGPGGGVGSGATVAPGNDDFSTAIDCVMAQAGSAPLAPTTIEPPLPVPASPPMKAGGLFVLDYREFRHDEHIHRLAVPVMSAYLAPYLDGELSVGAPLWMKVLAGLGALVGGVALKKAIDRA
jgi:hypothetical protein